MFHNLVVVAILIMVLWLGAMAYFIYVSGQQNDLADEIDKLREQLDEIEGGL